MPTIFPMVLMDDVTRCEFAAVSGFGPGTTHQIRYVAADYYKMITRYFTEFRQVGTWGGPNLVDITLSYGVDSDHHAASQPGTFGPPLDISFPGSWSVIEGSVLVPDFPDCPFADGVGPPHEDANVIESANGTLALTFSLFSPKCEQSDWATATEFWLPYDLAVTFSSQLQYLCEPSETSGTNSGNPMSTNYLGIDFTGGVAFPTATSSILLGDGTTSVFFGPTSTPDTFVINDVQTNNF